MQEIALTQGEFACVDDTDYELVSQFKWYAMYCHGIWYAAYDISHGKHVYMHELLCKKRPSMFIDHKDRNGLNNQRNNLRECTQSLNNANSRKRVGTTSEFKGVSFDSSRQRWIAQVSYEGRKLLQKRFDTEIEAALAYNDVALATFGEFATLNAV